MQSETEPYEVEIPKNIKDIEERAAYVAAEVTTDLYSRGCKPEELVDIVDVVADIVRGKMGYAIVKCGGKSFSLKLRNGKIRIEEKSG